MRFEALDAAGNRYSRDFADTTTVTNRPVYSGSGAAVTKTNSSSVVAAGDVFTCGIGNWMYLNDSLFPVTCEWATTSGIYRGTSLTITSEMLTISSYTMRVGLRVNNGSPVTGAWTTWWVSSNGAYESRSDYEFHSRTYSR
jgi:hypothetical protein